MQPLEFVLVVEESNVIVRLDCITSDSTLNHSYLLNGEQRDLCVNRNSSNRHALMKGVTCKALQSVYSSSGLVYVSRVATKTGYNGVSMNRHLLESCNSFLWFRPLYSFFVIQVWLQRHYPNKSDACQHDSECRFIEMSWSWFFRDFIDTYNIHSICFLGMEKHNATNSGWNVEQQIALYRPSAKYCFSCSLMDPRIVTWWS